MLGNCQGEIGFDIRPEFETHATKVQQLSFENIALQSERDEQTKKMEDEMINTKVSK